LDAVRAAYVASSLAAQKMVPRQRGLIVNISYWAARKHMGNLAGLVHIETVLRSGWFDLSNSESPEFIGRVIAALWLDIETA
jgi:dehydrogenase/reductase SDR family protein 1